MSGKSGRANSWSIIERMLNVLLVEKELESDSLESALKGHGFELLKIQYDPQFIEIVKDTSPDVIIFNLETPSNRLISDLHRLDQEQPLPVIIFANDGSIDTINKITKAEVSTYIVDGLVSQRVNTIIQIAVARFKHKQALRQSLEDARTQLEDRKQIDRAKAILIKTQNFTEDHAYHTLRKLAMDRNITLGEMARNVIAMAELLK